MSPPMPSFDSPPERMASSLPRGRGFRLTRRRAWWLTVGLVLMNVAWRGVRYGMNPPLWGDEAMLALSFQARNGWGEFLTPLIWSQLAPPGFLWLTDGMTRLLGLSEYVLRLWPMLAGMGAMLAFAGLAWRHLKRREAVLAVAVLAASYFPLRHSVEVKPYSTDLLVAVGVLWVTLEIFGRVRSTSGLPRHHANQWGVLALLALVAPWVSFTSIFVLGGCAVWLLVRALLRRDTMHVCLAIAVGLFAVMSFGVMAWAYGDVRAAEAGQYEAMAMWEEGFPPVREPWWIPWWLLDTHAGRMLSYPAGGKQFASAGTLLFCILGGVKLYRGGRRPLLWLLLAPLGFGLLAAAMGFYPYGGTVRTMLYAGPTICLLGGIGVAAACGFLLNRRQDLGVLAFCGVMLLAIVGGTVGSVTSPYKTIEDRDTRNVFRQLTTEASPEDVWVFARGRASASGRDDEREVLSGISASASQFYATRDGPRDIRIAPAPGTLDHDRPILLLIHDKVPDLDDQPHEAVLRPYLESLGEPDRVRRFPIGPDANLLFYSFSPR